AAQTHFRSLLLVKLDDSERPAWLSRHEIFLDLTRYGFSEVAGAIKHRAAEVGAVLKAESAVDRAIALAAHKRRRQEASILAQSRDGHRIAREELALVAEHVKAGIERFER